MIEPTLCHVYCSDAAGGHRMAWWQWGDARAGHLVVCVHGLSRQGRDFDVLARALLARAAGQGLPLRVACPDVAGRGQSDWLADPMGYQIPTYVADMLAMLQALHGQAAIERLDWVGTSMGGVIGMMLAGTPGLPLPAPINHLLLNDIGPAVEWPGLERIGRYLGKIGPFASQAAAADALRESARGFGPHTEDEWMALSRPMLRALPEGGWRLHYDPAIAVPFAQGTAEMNAKSEAALWKIYDRIAAQTLVLHGAQSDLLLPATVQAMAARGPRARWADCAGIGHAPTMVGGEPLRVALDFLLPSAAA